MGATFSVSTVIVNDHTIEQIIISLSEYGDETIMHRICDIQDEQFCRALVQLGWTRPADGSCEVT